MRSHHIADIVTDVAMPIIRIARTTVIHGGRSTAKDYEMSTQQPVWKYVGHVGDLDPIAYGGGYVYVDETGVYGPEMTWFEPGPDSEWADKGGATKLQEYRILLENNPEAEWWWDKLSDLATFTGQSVESLQADARSDNPLDRALLYDSLIHYYGAHEFDSYPVTRTEDEAYEKYAEELRAVEELYNKLSARSGEPPPNYDAEAGIHYGVIPINSVNSDAMDDVYQNGTDLGYEDAKEEAKKSVLHSVDLINEAREEFKQTLDEILSEPIGDWLSAEALGYFIEDNDLKLGGELDAEEVWNELEDQWSDFVSMSCAESGPYLYKRDGYVLKTDNDGIDLFVIKSAYYTLAAMCSPCAPNAGYLKNPGDMKSYCLGPEWFDDEYAPLPYDVYSVKTGELVEKAKETE